MGNTNLVAIKQRFGIIGFDAALERAIHIAVQVAPTDLSVLITGESGVGKENFPKIIHEYSAHKHGQYIAVNCGAIPEGTIDSELFGHEKGAFTSATETRKGYFEVADGGTIFLDEVADLPLATQVRLLRVLENGEFIKVGSSKVQKTSVRVVAATNAIMADRITKGKFREDLYYRLNSVPIYLPPLRERQEDILLLFTKFALDFSEKYKSPPVELLPDAVAMLKKYRWPGNIRQLKNITEQMSLLESESQIDANTLAKYLTSPMQSYLPVLAPREVEKFDHLEMEMLLSVLKEMRQELNDLKQQVRHLSGHDQLPTANHFIHPTYPHKIDLEPDVELLHKAAEQDDSFETPIIIDDSYSLLDNEKKLIKHALDKHNGKRKEAADELGISERTLYRKIKEFGIE
ncbi:MAG: sigma-54 dependent transcriptional regulator [Bacteroidales bacterium]|nr:sigma-54 dependent transcriptional regulator [Bacteroidales bacterium]